MMATPAFSVHVCGSFKPETWRSEMSVALHDAGFQTVTDVASEYASRYPVISDVGRKIPGNISGISSYPDRAREMSFNDIILARAASVCVFNFRSGTVSPDGVGTLAVAAASGCPCVVLMDASYFRAHEVAAICDTFGVVILGSSSSISAADVAHYAFGVVLSLAAVRERERQGLTARTAEA